MRFILKYIVLLFGYINLNNTYKDIDYTTKEWEDYKETLKRISK